MRKFLSKFLIFVTLMIITIITIFVLPPDKRSQESMLYSQIDKNILCDTTSSPRIILVGGSNLSFGIDSKKIQDSLKYNPINMGIQGSIGLKYMLSNVEKYVKEGDIIIVSPEYQQFYGDFANGEVALLSIVLDVLPGSIEMLDLSQYYSIIKNIPGYLHSKLRGYLSNNTFITNEDTWIGIYDRKTFNAFGDAYLHWKLQGINVEPYKINDKLNNGIFKALNEFRSFINKKNAYLYIAFPGYQESSFNNSRAQISEIKNILKKNKYNILSDPERYIIPDSMIYNTPYHLTKSGVDYRTNLLIKDLRQVFKTH